MSKFSLVYYGLVLVGGALPGNIFVNNAVGGVLEFVACLVAVPCIVWKGFTKTTSFSLYFASASCLISVFLSQIGRHKGIKLVLSYLRGCYVDVTRNNQM